MVNLRRNYPVGSLYGGELKYICDECGAIFKNEGCSCGRGAMHTSICILCEVKKKHPTPKMTPEQIDEKKQQIKERIGK
jgi:hypothetical protein